MNKIDIAQAMNFIDGNFQNGSEKELDILNPSTGKKIGVVSLANSKSLERAVNACEKAKENWASKTLKQRAQVIFKFRSLLEQNIHELSKLVSMESGKIYSEAKAEIEKGIELCEFASSMPQIVNDEIQEVSKGVECRTSSYPIGIVACITPFNFPHMVPMWTIPNALVLGNCVILKPSEKVPLSANKIALLLKEAGLPDGVF